jgi:peptide deformylase
VLQIVQAGDRVLRVPAQELTLEEILSDQTKELIEYMKETMRQAPGVGLAAPQIGVSVQLAVIEDREEYHTRLRPEQLRERQRQPIAFHVLINPRIVSSSEAQLEFFEGCLSIAGYSAIVPRSQAVTVEYLNELAENKTIHATGWYARILQHEIDHLAGILYIDRMQTRTLTTVDNLERLWKDLPVSEVQAKFRA